MNTTTPQIQLFAHHSSLIQIIINYPLHETRSRANNPAQILFIIRRRTILSCIVISPFFLTFNCHVNRVIGIIKFGLPRLSGQYLNLIADPRQRHNRERREIDNADYGCNDQLLFFAHPRFITRYSR